MKTKKELTEIFLHEANIEVTDAKVKEFLWAWWVNPVSKTSYRLTKEGHRFLTDVIKLQCYKIKLTSDFKAITRNFLLIDKHLASPFFIENKTTIYFYGEQDTLMVTLNGFNLQQYLETLSNQ